MNRCERLSTMLSLHRTSQRRKSRMTQGRTNSNIASHDAHCAAPAQNLHSQRFSKSAPQRTHSDSTLLSNRVSALRIQFPVPPNIFDARITFAPTRAFAVRFRLDRDFRCHYSREVSARSLH
jgi:hypothetical protein